MTVNNTIALAASDQCTPINPPNTPTVKPLKAFNPMLAMANNPINRPRSGGGERNWTIVCPMDENVRFNTPAVKRSDKDR